MLSRFWNACWITNKNISKLFSLIALTFFQAHAGNSSKVSITNFSVAQTGVLTRTFDVTDILTNGVYLSCNQDKAIYGYTCTSGSTSSTMTIVATFNGATASRYVSLVGQYGSTYYALSTYSSLGTSYQLSSGSETLSFTINLGKIMEGVSATAPTNGAANVQVTLYVVAETTANVNTVTSEEKASFVVNFDATPSATATLLVPVTGLYAEAGDKKVIIQGFTKPCTSCNYQFYLRTAGAFSNDDAGFGTAAVAAGSVKVEVPTTSSTNSNIGSVSISGLENGTTYYLAYAESDQAGNVYTTSGSGYYNYPEALVPNEVAGALSGNLSCISASIGGSGRRGAEWMFWSVLMVLIFLLVRRPLRGFSSRRPRFAGT